MTAKTTMEAIQTDKQQTTNWNFFFIFKFDAKIKASSVCVSLVVLKKSDNS